LVSFSKLIYILFFSFLICLIFLNKVRLLIKSRYCSSDICCIIVLFLYHLLSTDVLISTSFFLVFMLSLISITNSTISTSNSNIKAYLTLVVPEIVEKTVVITGTAIITIVFNNPILEAKTVLSTEDTSHCVNFNDAVLAVTVIKKKSGKIK